ncbi:MAG: site-2 protease family protein [Endomicrobium sp.]|nr:site-2 protease family protein [Endomicrobium sp.]
MAQGFISYVRGDDTAKMAGRLTLNPMVHLDLLGSVILPTVLLLAKFPLIIGWGKPVPVNCKNLKNPKLDVLLILLAGPISSMLLAVFSGIGIRLIKMFPSFQSGLGGSIGIFLYIMLGLNTLLLIVNLLPVPPLDGSKIIAYFLPEKVAEGYLGLNRYVCCTILFLLVLFVPINKFVWDFANAAL